MQMLPAFCYNIALSFKSAALKFLYQTHSVQLLNYMEQMLYFCFEAVMLNSFVLYLKM